MRLLIEPSDYVLRNVGDMAMLRMAVSRLAAMWPDALIQVLTDEPERLQIFCPEASPLRSAGRKQWLANGFLPIRLRPYVSQEFPISLRNRAPELVEVLWRRRLRHEPQLLQVLAQFTEAVSNADAVVVTGMGGITDAFPEYALALLETLALAVRRRKFIAMVGQGFGPLQAPALVARARAVLPFVHFFTLREDRASLPLLLSLGVAHERIVTTGDDAIEIAHHLRLARLGEGIGINLRASQYSGVDLSHLEPLRQVFLNAADKHKAPLVPIPISHVPNEADARLIELLMKGYENNSHTGLVPANPEAVIRQIQRCRLVITGSYHAAVFALAMGIPTIGLANSRYYIDKFRGLSALFGEGCETVVINEEYSIQRLESLIVTLWRSAPSLRPNLLKRALRQIQSGHKAYERLRSEVEAHVSKSRNWMRHFGHWG
jgi:colanic acid/amylovoran biosynthesis protein